MRVEDPFLQIWSYELNEQRGKNIIIITDDVVKDIIIITDDVIKDIIIVTDKVILQ